MNQATIEDLQDDISLAKLVSKKLAQISENPKLDMDTEIVDALILVKKTHQQYR